MKTILLVEDDPGMRELVSVLLRIDGYEVDEAENGRDALDRLQQMPELPCLVLLDLMMPVMSGTEMLKELHDNTRLASVPVIVLSANEPPPETKSLGYLRKPVDPRMLSKTVREHCGAPP